MGRGSGADGRLFLLGRFRLLRGDEDVAPRSTKARALIGCLALAHGGMLERTRIAALLWSEGSDAKASLRQCLRELRQALDPFGEGLIGSDSHRIWLDLPRLSIDALQVRALPRPTAPEHVESLRMAWAGELLADVEVDEREFDQWLLTERTALRAEAIAYLEEEFVRASGCGEGRSAEAAAQVVLAIEPTHETTHRRLMGFYAERGDTGLAIHQYETCRAALLRGVDAKPSSETEALLQAIKRRGTKPAMAARRDAENLPLLIRAPPAIAPRPLSMASVAIEEPVAPPSATLDRAVGAAIAASLREALARKRWIAVMEPPPASVSWHGSSESDDSHYSLRLVVLRFELKLRVAAELRRPYHGQLVWADHCDRLLGEDVFGVVDDIATAVAYWLDREIEVAEIARAAGVPGPPANAYDCILRAIPLIFKLTRQSFAMARKLLADAEQAAPNEPLVLAWRAFMSFLDIGQGWTADPQAARQELESIVRRALELDPHNPMALTVAGHIASFVEHDYEKALGLFERSLRLDPTSAYARDLSSLTLCYVGKADEGLARLDAARDLWERHPNPSFFRTTACIGLFLAGRYGEAVDLCRRTIRESPSFHATYRPLIASLGQLGRIEEARESLAALQQFEPDFSLDWFRANYPPLHPDDARRYVDGLRKGGVPG